jgi:phosphatidylserine/phosphatidylglycerophosphate/cardiolipin synthase-like enzyme
MNPVASVLRPSPQAEADARGALVGIGARGAIAAVIVALLGTVPCTSAQPAPTRASGVDQTDLTAAFTPGHALPVVLETIRSARSTIFVAAYSFTSRPVASALLDASRRGVGVQVLVDAGEATKRYSAARFLANQGVAVRINARYATQHNKFMVVDAVCVQTGSFNYTSSAAERNAENVLVVKNAPALAAQYSAEWRRLWDEGTDLGPAY